MNAEKECSLLSIDAWREAGGWTWNNWHKVGTVPVSVCDLAPRAMLRRLREVIDIPAGTVAVEDDGYNVVIVARGTGEPLCAVAYGEVV